MKVLAFVLSIISVTLIEFAAILLIVFSLPTLSAVNVIVPSIVTALFAYGPLALGSATFFWDFGASDGSRRYLRRFLVVLVGVEALAAIGLVVFAVVVGAPVWLPAILIGMAVILTAVAPLGGRALRRYDEKHGAPSPSWRPVDPSVIRRKIRTIIITSSVTFVIALVGIGLVFLSDGLTSSTLLETFAFAIEFAAIAGSLAGTIVSLPLARLMRAGAGGDVSVLQKVAKVVLRGKKLELSESEQLAAARYAGAAATYFPFMLGTLGLLYVGIGLQRVVDLFVGDRHRDSSSLLVDLVIVVGLVGVFAAIFPLQLVRTRRARQYAEEHVDLLREHELRDPVPGAVADPLG